MTFAEFLHHASFGQWVGTILLAAIVFDGVRALFKKG